MSHYTDTELDYIATQIARLMVYCGTRGRARVIDMPQQLRLPEVA